MRSLARAVGGGMLLLAALVPPGAAFVLAELEGWGALLALGPAGWAVLTGASLLPLALLLLLAGWWAQRGEMALLRGAMIRQADALTAARAAQDALLSETREQTAMVQELVRLGLGGLAAGKRQAEAQQAQITETRLHRLTAEWDLTERELAAILAAMWHLAHGWQAALPTPAELPLAILKMLPATAEEAAQIEVDERFVRQAALYRSTFETFVDRLPETGPVSRSLFRGMVHGRLDARLALLPRPDHGRFFDPATLVAE